MPVLASYRNQSIDFYTRATLVFNGLKKGFFERFRFKRSSPNLSELTNFGSLRNHQKIYDFLMISVEIEVNPSHPVQDEEKKLTQIIIFTLLCGASKGFMKALKAFIKSFKAPERSMKIKI